MYRTYALEGGESHGNDRTIEVVRVTLTFDNNNKME